MNTFTAEQLKEVMDTANKAILALEIANNDTCCDIFIEYRNNLRNTVVGKTLSSLNSKFNEDEFRQKYSLESFEKKKQIFQEVFMSTHDKYLQQLLELDEFFVDKDTPVTELERQIEVHNKYIKLYQEVADDELLNCFQSHLREFYGEVVSLEVTENLYREDLLKDVNERLLTSQKQLEYNKKLQNK